MNRKGVVKLHGKRIGIVWQDDRGYGFQYDAEYVGSPSAEPVSVGLPLRPEAYHSPTMIAFFDGLIPEGWLLEASVQHWKLDQRDRMGLLLAVCTDCIGAATVHAIEEPDNAAET